MSNPTKVTIEHNEIRKWAEHQGGVPARVRGASRDSDGSDILRIDFPGEGADPDLEQIPWDEWFRIFDETQLAFIYEERNAEVLPHGARTRRAPLLRNH
jgi:hypothetical protein